MLIAKSSRGSTRLVVTATCAAKWNTALAAHRGVRQQRLVADVGDDRLDPVAVACCQPVEVALDARRA